MKEAYFSLKRRASPGIDGETWQHYGERIDENLRDLSHRLKRGSFKVRPSRRVYLPKEGNETRAIGISTLEDKIVQRAMTKVLNSIYEEDFLGFSYGFREGRSQHQVLDALCVGIQQKKVNWILDADIRSFFDTLDHGWMMKFLEHRVGDRRLTRLIQKWLKAGVLEEGRQVHSEEGTVQGGSISPLLANIYLHYVLDLWTHQRRQKAANGDVIIVRWADDFIVGFQHRKEATRFLEELRERMGKFKLDLHPAKTRLLEFGRYAIQNRRERGEGKPETFNFLGFNHICGKTRTGKFMVLRQTMGKKWRAKLKEVYGVLRQRMHDPVPLQGNYLRSVVMGHVRYYGVPFNPNVA